MDLYNHFKTEGMHIFFVKPTLLLSLIARTQGLRCLMPMEMCLNQGDVSRESSQKLREVYSRIYMWEAGASFVHSS